MTRWTSWAATLKDTEGNKVAMAIEQLHHAETSLAATLLSLANRHQVDHEVFHVARDIAGWSQEHAQLLARTGPGYGIHLDASTPDAGGAGARLTQKTSQLVGRRHDPMLALLTDLRHVHVAAAGVCVDWVVLAQTAQALKDTDLLATSTRCHPRTRRQMNWAAAKIKELSPQAMSTG